MTMILLALLIAIVDRGHVLGFSTITEILENTNKRLPTQNSSKPLEVKLGFYLESIGNFRSEEMSFDVDMYAYMSWTDRRLRHNFHDLVLVNDDNIRKQLWLPDLYFANAIQAKVHDVTVPNFNMFIDRDGTIAYSCRFTMQISCSLQLQNYPMDVQTCGIQILSYAYIAKQVNVSWFEDSPIRYNDKIGLPEFEIKGVKPAYCNGTYTYAVTKDRYKVDRFSCLLGNIHLQRSIGYNLVQSYIPTGLIVIISWVSFWIDRRAVPARVTLSFTTLVSLTTLGNGLRFGLPQVSYIKAIDLWYGGGILMTCMFFVFCALLEFAIINSYMRKAEKYDAMSKKFVQARNENNETMEVKSEMRKLATENGSPLRSPKMSSKSPQTVHQSPALNGSIDEAARSKRRLRIAGDRIKFADEELPMTVINGKDSDSMSSYDNMSPRRRGTVHVRREDLDISDDDEEMWDRAVQQRNKPFVVYATDKGTSVFYNAKEYQQSKIFKYREKQRELEERKMAAQRKRKLSRYRLSVCENAYLTMSKSFSRTALMIDKGCRYGFPVAFFLWNLFYWSFYLYCQYRDSQNVS